LHPMRPRRPLRIRPPCGGSLLACSPGCPSATHPHNQCGT
jgi:hypothetical protein